MTKTKSTSNPCIVYEWEGETEVVPVRGDMLLVGRGTKADIRLADRSLSTSHCRVERTDSGIWKVIDLESKNGTYVNDRLIKQRQLRDGDRIRVGRQEMRFFKRVPGSSPVDALEALVLDAAREGGAESVRTAAARFALVADRAGYPGLLVDSELVRAAEHLQGVLTAMVEARKPRAVIEMIVDTLIAYTGAERGFFILAPENDRSREAKRGKRFKAVPTHESQERVVAARNFDREAVEDALSKISKSVERQVLKTGDPLIVTDASIDDRFTGQRSVAGLRLRSILAAPVRSAGEPLGTIYLDNRFERGVFNEEHLPAIRMFADQAAVALTSARLHAQNEERLEELTLAKSEVEELNRILADRVAQTSAELQEVRDQVLRDRHEAPLKYSYAGIIGNSPAMRDVFHLLDKVTDSEVPVLIQGESGTGKELVARAIHYNGARKNAAFVSENCAAIPESLLESELFGFKKGAFTGATADRKGLFEAANGGTLFLDEIGDMPMNMQKKLLRVLQEQEVRRVGGNRTIPIDVRVLAASNQDLRKLCEQGAFREDLYYRLNVITVNLPPLRDRQGDIELLVEHFLKEAAPGRGRRNQKRKRSGSQRIQAP